MEIIITVPQIWAPIEGFAGIYEVSNMGLVRSLPRFTQYKGKYGRMEDEKILKLNSSNGYKTVSLVLDKVKTTYMVHRLVGIAFIHNPLNKPFINHLDGMRWNNHYKNLEWSTNQENQIHARDVLGRWNRLPSPVS